MGRTNNKKFKNYSGPSEGEGTQHSCETDRDVTHYWGCGTVVMDRVRGRLREHRPRCSTLLGQVVVQW